MKVILRPAVLSLSFLFLLMLLSPAVFPQSGEDSAEASESGGVQIYRRLPATGENTVQAQWLKPRPDPQRSTQTGVTEFSGRLKLGGSAGLEAAGEERLNLLTDSTFSLIQPLDAASRITVGGTALRKDNPAGAQQNYELSVSFDLDRWSFSVDGSYDDEKSAAPDETTGDPVDKFDLDAGINAEVSTTLIESLPMHLRYSHVWTQADETGIRVEDKQTDSAEFSADGSIGPVGLSAEAGFHYLNDFQKYLKTVGVNGSISVGIPVGGFLTIEPSLASGYSRSDYTDTGNFSETTSLETLLGLSFDVTEEFLIQLRGGNESAWENSLLSGVPDELEIIGWTAEAGIDLETEAGFSSGGGYGFLTNNESGFSHEADVYAAYRAEDEGLLRELSGAMDYSGGYTPAFVLEEYAASWESGLALLFAEQLRIEGAYKGKLTGYPQKFKHLFDLSGTHSIGPAFQYSLNAGLTDTVDASASKLEHRYAAGITARPEGGERSVLLELTESVGILHYVPDTAAYGTDVNSTMDFRFAFPVFRPLRLRYSFQWEWVNRIEPALGPGSAFRHVPGFDIGDEDIPVGIVFEYGFSHGFRGFRHDISNTVTADFGSGFGAETTFTFSHYEDDGAYLTPFLFSLFGSYEF